MTEEEEEEDGAAPDEVVAEGGTCVGSGWWCEELGSGEPRLGKCVSNQCCVRGVTTGELGPCWWWWLCGAANASICGREARMSSGECGGSDVQWWGWWCGWGWAWGAALAGTALASTSSGERRRCSGDCWVWG